VLSNGANEKHRDESSSNSKSDDDEVEIINKINSGYSSISKSGEEDDRL
jgi:hypothetical protein